MRTWALVAFLCAVELLPVSAKGSLNELLNELADGAKPAPTAKKDLVGPVVSEAAIFNHECIKHQGVWNYNKSSLAFGCTPTSQAKLVEIYAAKGATRSAALQLQGLEEQARRSLARIWGPLAGVVPGVAGLVIAPGDSGWGGTAWLALIAGGAYLGSQIAVSSVPDPEEKFLKARQIFNDSLAEQRSASVPIPTIRP